jgi:pyruvate kinase
VPSIVATQMLTSMVSNSRPTRAEASDVFEAVMQGAHAVMVSEESSVGHDPERVVFTMEQIIREAEKLLETTQLPRFSPSAGDLCELADALAPAVYGIASVCAARNRKSTIINVSAHSGKVARILASLGLPQSILTFANSVKTIQSLALVYGIRAIRLPAGNDVVNKGPQPRSETSYFEAIRIAHQMGLLDRDSLAIVASSSGVADGFQVSSYPVAQVLEYKP